MVHGQQNIGDSNMIAETAAIEIKPEDTVFEIAEYQIIPNRQLILVRQKTMGSKMMPDGEQLHWHGFEFVPTSLIDFKSTSLLFAGNIMSFKEFFPITGVDFSSLQLIENSLGRTLILSSLENSVYLGQNVIDVSGYTHLRHSLFKNKQGQLFFIPFGYNNLKPVTLNLDAATLKHLAVNYYTDKNGLYDFGQMKMLESSKGQSIEPQLFDRYFIYGDAAYTYAEAYSDKVEPGPMRLDATKLREINMTYQSYLTDGKIILKLTDSFTNTMSPVVKAKDIIQINTLAEPVNEWDLFDTISIDTDQKGYSFYYLSPSMKGSGGYSYDLIKTANRFYGVTGSSESLKAKRLADVQIYNATTEKYETIDVSQFRRITTNFYNYKERLYYDDAYLVITDFPVNNLKVIRLNGQQTEFYTDGEKLFSGYNLGHLEALGSEDNRQYKLTALYDAVDWPSLQIINNTLMVDKNNIYQSDGGNLGKVIPIKELGIEVKVLKLVQ